MKITILTPTYKESEDMINIFLQNILEVKKELFKKDIILEHFFLNDGSKVKNLNSLTTHQSPEGLAITLLEGYEAVLSKDSLSDVIVRMDVQEHDPKDIIQGLKKLLLGNEAVFLPVVHFEVILENVLFFEKELTLLKNALNPINKNEVMRLYNNTFPLGFQIFKASALKKILPDLKKGFSVFKNKFNTIPTWGLDLLSAFLVAKFFPNNFDFYFNPEHTQEWKENKGQAKAEEQAKRASMMIEVAVELDCKSI